MKSLFIAIICVLAMSSFASKEENEDITFENEVLFLGQQVSDCGGCIAYADSRDDGSDRTLKKWNEDLESCRSSSSECSELSEG
tara:strand:- start:3754 stop:4005 length:252 start_codon:yes stop_codon:yes gene_type:complete